MNVLVDTCIWSLALRRSTPQSVSQILELKELINEQRVVMIGAIRQEILSGIREQVQFDLLRDKIRSFPDFPLLQEDYETAASFFNDCRRAGIQGSPTDFLICAVSARHSLPIFTTDKDFSAYQRHLAISLYQGDLRGGG
jgi:predicted nucleic acid-binding protein